MVTPWTQTSVITLPKTGNLQQRQIYGTISLISHPSKFMLNSTERTVRVEINREEIPGSKLSTCGYLLTYSRPYRENL